MFIILLDFLRWRSVHELNFTRFFSVTVKKGTCGGAYMRPEHAKYTRARVLFCFQRYVHRLYTYTAHVYYDRTSAGIWGGRYKYSRRRRFFGLRKLALGSD
jgi:hypothetical protein